MPEIKERLKSNLKERVTSITLIGDNVADAIGVLVDHLKKVEPVQGVCAMTIKLGDGSLLFIKKQAEITRKWAG